MSVNDSFEHNSRLANVTEAAVEKFDWGLDLGKALAKASAWDSEIWLALSRAWRTGVRTDEQATAVLALLLAHPKLGHFSDAATDLLVNWWCMDKTAKPSRGNLSTGEQIADRLWATGLSEASVSQEPTNGWFHEALNHPGGKIVEFWLYALSQWRTHAADNWPGTIPAVYRNRFESVVRGTSKGAQLGRVLLASQVRFLFANDPDWTSANVLPLLDFALDVQGARAAWDGFLSWGTWDEAILPYLLPLYEHSFPYLLIAGQRKRERLCEHLANIALFASLNPLESRWLDKFVVQAPDDARATWVTHVGMTLQSLSNNQVKNLWNRWLREYWQRRVYGQPSPLNKRELAAMTEWLPYLEAEFAAAAAEVCKMDPPEYDYTTLFADLCTKHIPEKFPKELTEVLAHILPKIRTGSSMFCSDLEKLAKAIPPSSITAAKFKNVCDELGRIGCRNAAEIFKSFQSSP